MNKDGKNRDVPGRTRLPCSDIHTALALYRSVAGWALLEGRPVTVSDIADTFDLSLRQAGDIMQFLLEEAGAYLQTEKRVVSRPRQGRRNALLVQAIDTDGFARLLQAREKEVLTRLSRREALRQSRTWFVSRRPGEAVPAELQAMFVAGAGDGEGRRHRRRNGEWTFCEYVNQ
ncbi:hypothetical protein QDX92_004649 [Salmonella enterica]|nr:hypothetical protein [Salmonella enterica]EGD1407065.1 hypothetical protein [Salmonella enterica]EJE9658136.1 hypothetical protein [Salmonella enterica]EJE9776508.1 hypothetical protein [Salmonella enterica]EJF5536858.1 hypothetical protein [Salmonella enterica]